MERNIMKDSAQINQEPIGRSNEKPYGIQHDALDYYRPNYLSPERMSSYSYQYRLALETCAKNFLNIGSANKILKNLLESPTIRVIDIDLDYWTKPNINAALPFLPLPDKSVDVVMCFQMLEHLPFKMFESNIREIKRIAKDYILISLPDRTVSKVEKLKYSIYKLFKRPKEWSFYKSPPLENEHFWEIGYMDISEISILEFLENEGLQIVKHFRNRLNRYHHFFVMKI